MIDRLRSLLPAPWSKSKPVVPVVRIHGAIGLATPLRPGVTMGGIAPLLEKAFAIKKAPAVAVVVNSPGGSPVQSHLIFKRIRALAEETGKPVLVFVEDVCASGGYMIAVAGDEIYVDEHSIVGSIGVVSQGFGFVGLIDKLGIDRAAVESAMDSDVVQATIEEVYGLANTLSLTGTPSYVVGDAVYVGAVGYDTLQGQVNKLSCGEATC